MSKKDKISLGAEQIHNSRELGKLIRSFRTGHRFTLERVSGMTGVGMRFLSELERGKETVQLGLVLQIINQLGLEIIIQPRDHDKKNK